ncbi:glycoside hydrolase family 5 protein [Vibrio nomapromontoriensis]|uniref:glycoside hydrolase family 5 protein n=1 Tax=Vibrio nomapromontoriensis TaxID=2910246 RepID=UPI003D1394CB
MIVQYIIRIAVLVIVIVVQPISVYAAQQEGSSLSCSTFPLSTQGRYIVNNCNERFKLKSVNWFGASDEGNIPGGLRFKHRDTIVSLLKEKGFNSVRLPFSNEMLRVNDPVANWQVSANPDLVGLKPIEVFDAVVKSLTDQNIAVILNNHTTYSEWCCGLDSNGLWYSGEYTTDRWVADWVFLTGRYKDNKAVVGADLRNEVRTANTLHNPNWGGGDMNDWRWTAERAGNAVLAENPDMLIIVEGINWQGATPALGGWRPVIEGAKTNPVNLKRPNKLIYAAHNYAYTGPRHMGADSVWYGNGPKYQDLTLEELRQTIDKEFAFVSELERIYTAPIWLSEFGANFDPSKASDLEKKWLENIVDLLIEKDYSFAWWPLNATRVQQVIKLDDYALLTEDWGQFRNDWRFEHIDRLLTHEGKQGIVGSYAEWRLVNFEGHDNNQSQTISDWDNGANKGTCVDGMRVIGVAQWDRILCSDMSYGNLWPDNPHTVTVTSETRPRGYDWAWGTTKYECPKGYYVAGVSSRSWGTSGVLCAESKNPLGEQCKTLWFDWGDNRLSQKGADWAPGVYKSQAADNQYIAGVAQGNGHAKAILVCE